MSDPEIAAGHVVSGRYRLVSRLGEGGMGEVWRADHITLRSQVAIKLLHRAVLDSEDGLERFLREAQAAAMLRSPHVVQILDHGVDEGVPYIAMELLDGESLAARLDRGSTLSLAQTARLVTHVARAIGKAHDAGIVHRDLKPDNIFIVQNDDEEVIKVLDFGIAKMEPALAEPASKINTRQGSLLGTPHYMSPEQVRGHGVDWRSDLWSLAIIAFECVCGRVPFDGRSVGDLLILICSEPLPVPSTRRPLPPAFDAWFARAAARDPDARFQSAKEMAEALRAAIGEEPREAASFSAPPAARDGAARPSHDSVRQVGDDARTLDAAAVGEPGSSPIDPGARAAIEQARTLALGGTMSGAATSPAIARPRLGGRPLLLVAGAVTACALGVAAWFGLAGRGSGVTVGSAAEALQAPVSAPLPALSAPAAPAVAPSASVAPQPSATAAAAEGSARATMPSAKGSIPAIPASRRAKQHPSDELVF